jgi:hypothetical protein
MDAKVNPGEFSLSIFYLYEINGSKEKFIENSNNKNRRSVLSKSMALE